MNLLWLKIVLSFIKYTGSIAHASGYVKISLKGTYTYNPNSGEIVSASSPTVTEISFEDFTDWSMRYKNLSTKKSIAKNKMTVTFSAKLNVEGTYVYGGVVFDEKMGSVSAAIKGDASGVL